MSGGGQATAGTDLGGTNTELMYWGSTYGAQFESGFKLVLGFELRSSSLHGRCFTH